MKSRLFVPLSIFLLLAGCNPVGTESNTEETVELTPLQYHQYTAYKGDLNGDGSDEFLTFEMGPTTEGTGGYTLRIGDASVTGMDDNLEGYFGVVDLDSSESGMEIAVSNYGPSTDYSTDFYRYDGKDFVSLGNVPGLYEEMGFDGAGNISTYTRGAILDTWFFNSTYALDATGELAMVPQDLYERYTEVTMLQAMDFVTSPTDATVAFHLNAGDKAVISGCDNVAWCQLMTMAGETGWFEVENYNAIKGTGFDSGDVFEGLSFAD